MNSSTTPKPELPEFTILACPGWQDYALLDSGDGQKLERYGSYIFVRPEPQAMWSPRLLEKDWKAAHAIFEPTREESGGHWRFQRPVPDSWVMAYQAIKFRAQPTAGRHLGVFPEQAVQWDWTQAQIRQAGRPIQVLNLFGYTGLASLAAAEAGARVTHLDASRKAVTWARENQSLSGLEDRPIRWIVDDALKFVQREARRGVQYDGIILDPPKFGRGPKGEVWEFFELFPSLLEACKQILSQQPRFLVVTAYAIRASALSLHYSLQQMMAKYGGSVESGELALQEQSAGRLVPTSIYSRWQEAS